MKYAIDDATGLATLQRRQIPTETTRITLGGPFVDEMLERRINASYFACGCEEGSVAVLGAFAVSTYGAVTTGLEGPFVWWRIAVYLAVAALGGKGIGLVLARLRLRRVLQELTAISQRSPRMA